MAAIDDLNALLSGLPGYALLTDGMKNAALAGALIPDVDNVWPGEDAYVATYDIYFAATNLVGFLKAQPVVRSTSSEGTSISVDAPDWSALQEFYRSQSPIMLATGAGTLGFIYIPDAPHVKRVPMTYGGGENSGNVDTDLA